MRNLIILFTTVFSLLPAVVFCQKPTMRDLSGRVVELVNGKPVGVEHIEVSVENVHRDFTRQDGSFKLKIPQDRDYITIVLKGTPHKMITPMAGLVNMPPDRDLQVIICGAQNRKLLQEVERLNSRISTLEKENALSKRQAAAMYQTLLDTVLFFQTKINALESENTAAQLELDEKDRKIRTLEADQQKLLLDLETALQEKYLRQKGAFDQISAELLEYLSRLKDLRLRCASHHLTSYTRNPAAVTDLQKVKSTYNDAWQAITTNHQNHVLAVRKNWESPGAFSSLESTYAYLLQDVHQEVVRPVDERVFGPVTAYYNGELGRMKAERESKKEAAALLPELVDSIRKLEDRIQETLDTMKKNI